MSLIICYSDNPNLIKECRISRNYAKFLISETVFSTEENLAFFSGLDSQQSVLETGDKSCVSKVDFIYLIIGICKVPSGLLGYLLTIGHEQT